MSQTTEFHTVTISLGDLAKRYERGFLCHCVERMAKPIRRDNEDAYANLLQVFCREFPDVCEIERFSEYTRRIVESGRGGTVFEHCVDPELIDSNLSARKYRQELLALLIERYGRNHMLNFLVKFECMQG